MPSILGVSFMPWGADLVADLSRIEAWIQRQDEELLYQPDRDQRDISTLTWCTTENVRWVVVEPYWYGIPGAPRIPVEEAHGLIECPSCGRDGLPLGAPALTLCTLPSGENGYEHTLYCQDGHDEYFAWIHFYGVEDFGRVLRYIETQFFGVRCLYSSEQDTFPRETFASDADSPL